VSNSFERREYFRPEIFETRKIEYALGAFDTETFEGLVLNISDSGICLLVSNRFSIGQEITLKDFDIYGSSKTATVQWIEKADKRHYKIGLIFLK
jgi:c-di-GMP-binding flagellar brake protein YcgR